MDADDPVEADSSEDDSDSDDDTAALLAELNKIKKERAVDEAKKDQEKKVEDEKIRMENILSGNPLLNYSNGSRGEMKVSDFCSIFHRYFIIYLPKADQNSLISLKITVRSSFLKSVIC